MLRLRRQPAGGRRKGMERSVDTGFAAWPYFLLDPHLERLRDEPEFKRLMTGLEKRYGAIEIRRL